MSDGDENLEELLRQQAELSRKIAAARRKKEAQAAAPAPVPKFKVGDMVVRKPGTSTSELEYGRAYAVKRIMTTEGRIRYEFQDTEFDPIDEADAPILLEAYEDELLRYVAAPAAPASSSSSSSSSAASSPAAATDPKRFFGLDNKLLIRLFEDRWKNREYSDMRKHFMKITEKRNQEETLQYIYSQIRAGRQFFFS